jgi:hypothetical protein
LKIPFRKKTIPEDFKIFFFAFKKIQILFYLGVGGGGGGGIKGGGHMLHHIFSLFSQMSCTLVEGQVQDMSCK